MSLTDDIKSDRVEIRKEIESLASIVVLEACNSIENARRFRPVVAALIGTQTELHFPIWRNPHEKQKVFDKIYNDLAERNVSGSVCAFPGVYVSGIKENQRKRDAIVIMVHTQDWQRMTVLPFHINSDDDVEWHEPYSTDDFDSPLVSTPCFD